MSEPEIIEAFRKLHTAWLGAQHRCEMNDEMDALAKLLGLNPLTLDEETVIAE